MKLKRLALRIILKAQKNYLKIKNLRLIDFYKVGFDFNKKIPDIIHLKSLVLFCVIFSAFTLFFFGLSFNTMKEMYLKDLKLSGGTYSEGNLGKFLRINPFYSQTNPVDENAVSLLFNGLMKRGADRKLEKDLAESLEVSLDKKVYTFKLRQDVLWHDGERFDADDVIFTINTIQNPDIRSSYYETWKGVKVEKLNDYEVKFVLKQTLESFLEDTTLKIIPKHVLEKVPSINFQTAEFNNKPIGTGPYKFVSLKKSSDKETLFLEINEKFFDTKPNIMQVKLISYTNSDQIINDYLKNNINSIGTSNKELSEKISDFESVRSLEYQLPRYVVAIFNTNSGWLKDKNLRLAIFNGINKNEVIKEAIGGKGLLANAPILPGIFGSNKEISQSNYDLSKAREFLSSSGYELKDGYYQKDGKGLELKIGVGLSEEMRETAEIISRDLDKIGLKSQVVSRDRISFQKETVRSRDYDILVIGQSLGLYPDLFSYWHSSQVNDPGLNLSGFKDRKLDKFLEQYREAIDQSEKKSKLEEIQKVLIDEALAVYLYNPFYYLSVSPEVKGIEPGKVIYEQDKYSNIADWYIEYQKVMRD